MRRYLAGLCALGVLLAQPPALAAQQTGSIAGQVVEADTDRPLPNMQVQLVGTTRMMLTNEEGRFLFAGIPAGAYELRVTGIGYSQGTERVTVAAGQSATTRIALATSALQLDALVVSAATGQIERKRELGNTVGRISADQIEPAATSTVSQVLNARSPGVSVASTSGTVGANQRIRIRGSNSISLVNEPLLIIDDAGKLNDTNLRIIQLIYDYTEGSCGIVMADDRRAIGGVFRNRL